MADYLSVNRRIWDERAPIHAASADYAFDPFVADPAFLSGVVRFDRPRLGDITGLRGVHLQCHIGTDTVSLARLGARMTGLDLSEASLEQARRLAKDTGTDVDFHHADVYRAAEVLGAGPVRPGLHRGRGAVLAAQRGPVGDRGHRAAAAGRAALHPGGTPDAVGAGRDRQPGHPALLPITGSTGRRTAG